MTALPPRGPGDRKSSHEQVQAASAVQDSVEKRPGEKSSCVVAIDGPSGAGKSTLAAALAYRLGCEWLDTGAMYRAVTLAALERGDDLEDGAVIAEIAAKSTIEVEGVKAGLLDKGPTLRSRPGPSVPAGPGAKTVGERSQEGSSVRSRVLLDGRDVSVRIREKDVNEAVSQVASHAGVREELVRRQREWAEARPVSVVEGRDIASAVLPQATLKIFLTADSQERARRRAEEMGATDTSEVAHDIKRRDELDSTRRLSPLARDPSAIVINTTNRSVSDVVDEIVAMLPYDTCPSSPKPLPDSWPERDPYYTIGYCLCRSIAIGAARAWFHIEISGQENLPSKGPFILAPVHRSNIDFLLIAAAVRRRKLRYMVKDQVWKVPMLGKLVSSLGGFPVHRGAVDRKALKQAELALKAGQVLVLFPEGNRRSGNLVEDLHEGAAFLALREGVPIVPVGIGGSERAMPKGSKWIRPAVIQLVVGEPIFPPSLPQGSRVSRSAIQALTAETASRLQQLLDSAENRAQARRSRSQVERITRP